MLIYFCAVITTCITLLQNEAWYVEILTTWAAVSWYVMSVTFKASTPYKSPYVHSDGPSTWSTRGLLNPIIS